MQNIGAHCATMLCIVNLCWRFMKSTAEQCSMSEEPEFGLFDRSSETHVTARDLPHWFQPNVAVFVTFQTADSLPKSAVLRMDAEIRDWFQRHGQVIPNSVPLPDVSVVRTDLRDDYRRLKARLLHWELDSYHGECVLRDPEISAIVMHALRHFDTDRYDLDCAIVMPNHVHLLAQFRLPTTCRKQCRSWLTFTARQINLSLQRTGAFWRSEAFDHLVRSVEQFQYLQKYIEDNGSRARLKPGHYRFWKRGLP